MPPSFIFKPIEKPTQKWQSKKCDTDHQISVMMHPTHGVAMTTIEVRAARSDRMWIFYSKHCAKFNLLEQYPTICAASSGTDEVKYARCHVYPDDKRRTHTFRITPVTLGQAIFYTPFCKFCCWLNIDYGNNRTKWLDGKFYNCQ